MDDPCLFTGFQKSFQNFIYRIAKSGRHGWNVHLGELHFSSFGIEVLYKWFLHGSSSVQLIKADCKFQAFTVQVPGSPSTAKLNELPQPF